MKGTIYGKRLPKGKQLKKGLEPLRQMNPEWLGVGQTRFISRQKQRFTHHTAQNPHPTGNVALKPGLKRPVQELNPLAPEFSFKF
jgi:hypothetical protein